MAVRTSSAQWQGNLKQGAGTMTVGSGAAVLPFSHASRFESGDGTNPEELIGAAQAGCFSMFLAALLTKAGFTPTRITTTAKVHLGEGPTITLIELDTQAQVPNLSDADLQHHAAQAKANCPVAKALTGPQISLQVRLVK